ncbi:MAG: bifunctional oligoribonuclease/PAP phosphatase NrnA [Dysgonamonadaceae bacterium]|jgi:phosphoesterase RecJ-like protein|nr:bifunctional oligoribonuclease/PAP phosphatase NrnA [Dysgonamonadaceae bacterium]
MLNKIISEANIQKAKKLINKCDKIVIVTHVSPDGDAVGSSLALYHFFIEIGKWANVVVPNDYPGFLKWMPGAKNIIIGNWKESLTAEIIDSADLLFCVDFNTLNRIEQLESLVVQSKAKKVMIDHHPCPENFCDVTISHPEISSTSELIFRFICRMGMFEYLNKRCAESIFTGMMTDTGAFTYNSNSPAIYYIISELINKGINKDAIYSKVYNNNTENRTRLQGYAINEKMKIFKEYKTSLITLSQEELKRYQWKKGDTEGFANIPLTIENIGFSAFIREDDNDDIRLSFRSKNKFPANEFASTFFNGGGHLNAAGGEFKGKLEDAVALFEEVLPKFIQQYSELI